MDNDGTTDALPAPGHTQRMAYVLLSPRQKTSSTVFLHGPYQSDPFVVSTSQALGRGHRVKRPKLSVPSPTLSDLECDSQNLNLISPTKTTSSPQKHASSSRGAWCHQCHRSVNIVDAHRCSTCGVAYCEKCLMHRYSLVVKATVASTWVCPRCTGYCDCAGCLRKRGSYNKWKRSKTTISAPPPPPLVDDTEGTIIKNVDIKRDGSRPISSASPVKIKGNDVAFPAIPTIPSFSAPWSPGTNLKDGTMWTSEAAEYYSDAYSLIDQKTIVLFENNRPTPETTLHSMSPYASADTLTPSRNPIIVPDATYYSHKHSQFYSCNASSSSPPTFHDFILSSPELVPMLINHGDATPSSPIAPPSYEWGDFYVHCDDAVLPLEEVSNSMAQCSHTSVATCTCSPSAVARLDDPETFARFINIDLLEDTPSSIHGVAPEDPH